MVADAAAGKMPAYGDTGLNIVHVDDVATGHLLAWRKGKIGERYVIGGANLSLAEILHQIAVICSRKPPTIKVPQSLVLPIAFLAEGWTRLTGGDQPFVSVDSVKMARKKMYFSSAKAERVLGYKYRSAQVAFNDAVGWFRENGYLS